MPNRASSRRLPLWLGWLGVVVWVVAPIAATTLIAMQNRSAEFAAPSSAWVPVETSLAPAAHDIDIALKWSSGTDLLAPAWQGVVQSVDVQVGQAVGDGTVIATVDGVRRIAWHTPGAFYRPLGIGDEGSDVSWLKSLLAARGAVLEMDDQFDWETVGAVQALADDLGVDDNSVEQFEPAWIVYLPASINRVESVGLVAGSPAPAAGESLASGAPTLAQAAVVRASSSLQPAGSEQLSSAQAAALYQNRVSNDAIDVGEKDQLSYLGEAILVAGTPALLAPDSLAAMSLKLTPDTTSVPGKLLRATTEGEVQVPAASIATGSEALICVRDGQTVREMTVVVLSSAEGGTRIVATLNDRDFVRVPGPSAMYPCTSNSKS